MKNSGKVLAVLLLLLVRRPAHAECRVSTTGLNFGAYDVVSAASRDSTTTLTVTCDRNPPVDVSVSIGASPGSRGFNPRQMRSAAPGTDRLNYNLYTTPSMSTVGLKKINRNRIVTMTIYGRIPPGQNVSVGIYSDQVTVTINP